MSTTLVHDWATPAEEAADPQRASIPEMVPTDPDPGTQDLAPLNAVTATTLPTHITRSLIGGTSALTLGVIIERGCGFLANLLAARFAGTSTYGAYSFAISTANQISTYASGGMGATAARFSGKYPHGTPGYSTLARSLTIVSLISASLAFVILWFGASPLASLLHMPGFVHLLRWASVSAAGIILLECARGFFVGQRRLTAIVLLSIAVGVGMITLLPAAAHRRNPIQMIAIQGAVTLSAVAVCLLFSRRLHLHAEAGSGSLPLKSMLREVWGFGLVQLAGLVGSNLAGWWLLFLVARGDSTMVQTGFFGIASQLRNIVGIAPSLLTEGAYAVMADPDEDSLKTPHRVMALCTFASLAVALILASTGIIVLPWVLTLLYGRAYAAAGLAIAIALAIAVVHMGNAPAAARLTIVSIRASGVINTIWAVFIALAATAFLLHGGGAWQAMTIYLAGHVLSSTLVLFTLHHKDHLPSGMVPLFSFATASAITLASLALLRSFRPEYAAHVNATMVSVLVLIVGGLALFGETYDWLPSPQALSHLRDRVLRRSA